MERKKINKLDSCLWIGALMFVCGVAWIGYAIYAEIHEVPLITAAQENKWDKVKEMLRKGADPNDISDDQNFRTALYWAIPEGSVDVVRLMIEKHVDVNSIDTHGQTALDWADFDRTRQHPERSEIIGLLKQAGAKHAEELRSR